MDGLHKGLFIVLEGIDGCGKSTQIEAVTQWIRMTGCPVHTTFEPTDGPVGRLIREMLSGRIAVDQRTIALLFAADRSDHIVNETNGIKKKTAEGTVVLCDRYYFSSYAYHGRYLDMEWVIQLNKVNSDLLKPDITLFIDADPQLCLDRIQKDRKHLDMYERLDIMTQVRDSYLAAFEKLKNQETVVVIDGNRTVQAVQAQIRKAVLPFLKKVDVCPESLDSTKG